VKGSSGGRRWLRRRSFFFSPLLRCAVFFLCFSFSLPLFFLLPAGIVAVAFGGSKWSCCGGGGGGMAMLDGGGRRPLWRERSSCWEPENPPCFCFVPSLFLFFLSSIWPLFSIPFSLLSSCFPLCHCLLSFSKIFAPPACWFLLWYL